MNTLKNKNNDNYLSKLAVGKSLLKEYKTSECARTVYLNDGDEFQIQLFNPETTEIGAEIFIDNEPLSNIIILHPGERMWLERYTDKAKKFKFRIYTVDGDSKAVEKAIAHNGEIKIKFYKKEKPIIVDTYHPRTYIYRDWHPYEPINIWYNTCTTSTGNADTVLTATDGVNFNSCDRSFSLDDAVNVNYCACDISTASATAEINCSVDANTSITGSATRCKKSFVPEPSAFQYSEYENGASSASFDSSADLSLIETGRVSEGSHSNQKFETINIDLETWPFKTEEFKILPYSRKPYTSSDAKKIYCSNCGRKLNGRFKFCPYCGEKID